MNEKNYKGLRKQLDNGSLDIPSQITILEIAYNLEQQLQEYKDKDCRSKTMYINATPPRSGKTYIAKLEQQLQSYKQKEDKLREHCNHYLNDLLIIEVDKIPLQIVLQILNEGDK